jgi:hypothetical protein
MPTPIDAKNVLDREFLGIRCRLIELAATFDRIDRADGAVTDDPRWLQIRRSLAMLAGGDGGRAQGIELLFSLPYDPKEATGG